MLVSFGRCVRLGVSSFVGFGRVRLFCCVQLFIFEVFWDSGVNDAICGCLRGQKLIADRFSGADLGRCFVRVVRKARGPSICSFVLLGSVARF